ncbi:hypothetical protein [Algivirga pacifica]|uniref:Uncharacterized protein n=1 Tax=Algivirga pacifica TaxID=1162670 RepID=A0ABP9D6G8_9BACT
MKKYLIVFSLLLTTFPLFAQDKLQHISHAQEEQFKLRVKQLDEFIKRFNLEIDYDGNKIKEPTADLRMEGIHRLIDAVYTRGLNEEKAAVVKEFVQQVVENNTALSFYDNHWYAEVNVDVEYKGTSEKITLVMQQETNTKKISRWIIRSVKADFLSVKPTKMTASLSPISHELNFMKLMTAAEQHPDNFANYAGTTFKEDQRNVFFYLLKTGDLKMNQVDQIRYHFLQADNWVFTVDHFERSTDNIGWLISDVSRVADKEKELYKLGVLGLTQ